MIEELTLTRQTFLSEFLLQGRGNFQKSRT